MYNKYQEALHVPCNNNERANEPKIEEEKNHPIPWKTRKIVQDSLLPNTKKEKTTITSCVVDPVSPSSPEPSEFGVSRTNSSHMLLYRNCSVRFLYAGRKKCNGWFLHNGDSLASLDDDEVIGLSCADLCIREFLYTVHPLKVYPGTGSRSLSSFSHRPRYKITLHIRVTQWVFVQLIAGIRSDHLDGGWW